MSARDDCPECGGCNWNSLGCMTCGLEFFPPSEAYQDAVRASVAERVAQLWEERVPAGKESPIERLFRDASEDNWWSGSALVQQHLVRAGNQDYWIDFAVPAWRFGIELDGHATHSSPAAIAKDRRRQRALEREGWTICRFGGQEVTQNAVSCVREAEAALQTLIASREAQ